MVYLLFVVERTYVRTVWGKKKMHVIVIFLRKMLVIFFFVITLYRF